MYRPKAVATVVKNNLSSSTTSKNKQLFLYHNNKVVVKCTSNVTNYYNRNFMRLLIRNKTTMTTTSETTTSATKNNNIKKDPLAGYTFTKPNTKITKNTTQNQQSQNQQKSQQNQQPTSIQLFLNAGLPLILFSLGSAYILKKGIEGKTKEYETSKGQISKSDRQIKLEKEKNDMINKLNTDLKNKQFDNTKRIERPEDILQRRKLDREKRNIWYRRWWRSIVGS